MERKSELLKLTDMIKLEILPEYNRLIRSGRISEEDAEKMKRLEVAFSSFDYSLSGALIQYNDSELNLMKKRLDLIIKEMQSIIDDDSIKSKVNSICIKSENSMLDDDEKNIIKNKVP